MNAIAKHFMRVRFQQRVDALNKAGIPVTQKTVYDESIQVGVPVPRVGADKNHGRRQADHEVSYSKFMMDFVISGLRQMTLAVVRPRRKTVFDNEPSTSPNGTVSGRVVLEEIPADIAVIGDDMIIFAEEFSVGQCVVSLSLLMGATAAALYIQGIDFLASVIKVAAWCALVVFWLGLLLGPLWRRQIAIDLRRGEVIVRRGPLFVLQTKRTGLQEFDAFTVDTQRATVTNRNVQRNRTRYLVGRSYLLTGKTNLELLNRTFEASDAVEDHLALAIENRLRSALSGHLGKKE